MELHRVFFLLLVARYVTAEPDLLYMSQICGETITVGVLGARMDSQVAFQYSSNTDCSLTIIAPIGLQLVLNVDRVDLEGTLSSCTDSLNVYDGILQVDLIAQICGDSASAVADIVSTTGALTLHFTSDSSVENDGFYVAFNPFKTAPCTDDDYSFKCDNDRCINQTLESDLYDNCGDNSDESSSTDFDTFDDDLQDAIEGAFRLGIGVLVAIIVGCIVVAVVVIVCCACLCYHCCCKPSPAQQQTTYQVLTNPQQQQVMVMQPAGQAAYPAQQPGAYPPQQPGAYPAQQPGAHPPQQPVA